MVEPLVQYINVWRSEGGELLMYYEGMLRVIPLGMKLY